MGDRNKFIHIFLCVLGLRKTEEEEEEMRDIERERPEGRP